MRHPRLAALAASTALALIPVARPWSASGAVPTDPLYAKQWGLTNIHAPQAWSRATGAGVTIAIVDSGIDAQHPELAGKIVGGASWICAEGVPMPCADWDDENGHGTHVAGIAAAPIDGVGVVGVAPDAKLLAVRVLNAEGDGIASDIAAGVRWAVDHGADVINMSLGGLPVVTQLVDSDDPDSVSVAMQYALDHNVLVVFAAGNESAPLCDPESFDRAGDALCVGAVDRRSVHANYSNLGYGLDVVAPGGLGGLILCDFDEDIWSTYAVDQDPVEDCPGGGPGYETLSGTSMATPFVTGVAALLAQKGIRGAAAAARIISTATDLGVPGADDVYGAGLVDASRALPATLTLRTTTTSTTSSTSTSTTSTTASTTTTTTAH